MAAAIGRLKQGKRCARAFSRHDLPELCACGRPRKGRAQGMPGADRTRGSRATESTGV